MKKLNCDVLIIGSGLVGLATAHCLSSFGYDIIIADSRVFGEKKISLKDTRTVAISEGSKFFLDDLSLWNSLVKYVEPIKKIKVFDRSLVNKIFFENKERSENLGYVIENSIFSKILRNKLKKISNVKILYGHKLNNIISDDNFSKSYFADQIIKAKLTIAADGKNSSVRDILNKKIYKKVYAENAFVVNFFHDKPIRNTAYEIFYKTGPLAILPMKPTKAFFQSSVIWSNEELYLRKLMQCDNTFIAKIIEERIGEIIGNISKINSKQVFPLSAHINETFIDNRIIYIGDSAHSIHPIAGQGWNLGIKDIKNLNNVCKILEPKNSEFGNKIFCKKYNDLSYKNSFQLYQITDKLNLHFKNNNQLYRLMSNLGFKIIEKNSYLKNEITKYAMGF